MLCSYFIREGMFALSMASGAQAIALVREGHPDIVLLDLGQPDVPGEDVAREIRSFSDIPILVVTAKSSEAHRIQGLELGADDYITKPFSPRELVLRTLAVLRRTGAASPADGRWSFGHGELVIDEARHEALVRGELVDLTPTEWGLLVLLAGTPGRVYSRLQLINRVRGYEFDGYERTVDSHVKNLRRKIELDPGRPQIVETVLGTGYRLRLARDG
jgi:DNA-binding response OmpR family regulator